MNTQNLLIHCPAKPGFNRIFDVGEYNMKLTGFGLLVLRAGESRQSDTGSFEVALVLLGGKCRVTGDGFDFVEVGGRKNVFDGKPYTVYLPRNTKYTVTALTDVEIAVNSSPASRDTARPTVITPEMTRSFSLGRDNFTRQATVMLDETFDSEHFYIGEGLIPSGNWSGYPPHRHDIDNPPEEIDMEETYFYLFDPPQGRQELRHRRDRRRIPSALRRSRLSDVLSLDHDRRVQPGPDLLEGSRPRLGEVTR